MRRLVYFVATTADGFIAGPQGDFDFFPMQGDHVAAQLSELPETIPAHVRSALSLPLHQGRFDTVLMGRKTYALALAQGVTDPYAPLATWVFSSQLEPGRQGLVQVTRESPASVVRALKEAPGRDLWLCGGGQLATALLGEIDELVLKVNPVLALDGVRVFSGPFRPQALRLRSRRAFDSGVTWLSFEVVHS